MHDIALDLLILLAGIWLVAVTLRPLGLPTIMGELIVGVPRGVGGIPTTTRQRQRDQA